MYKFAGKLSIKPLLICFMLSLAACTTLQPQGQWQSNPTPLTAIKKPLVVVLVSDPVIRKKTEADWVLDLRGDGIQAAPGYAAIGALEEVSAEKLAALQQQYQFDGLVLASLMLDAEAAQERHEAMAAHLQYHKNLAFDVFMQRMEMVTIKVAVFDLNSSRLRWRALYQVPVKGGAIDWQQVAKSANKAMTAAGLAPPQPKPDPKEEKASAP